MKDKTFLTELRDALNNLYDPVQLRHSPLVHRLGLGDQEDTSQVLQQKLTKTIGEMEPSDEVPSSSRAWRIYELLFCRYVQQLSAAQVSAQLGISERHLRREQNAAIEALGYKLEEKCDFKIDSATRQESIADNTTPDESVSPPVREELAWLANVARDQSTDIQQTVHAALDLVEHMVQKHHTELTTHIKASIPRVAVHPVAFRQMLINVLSVALPWLSSGNLEITARRKDWEVRVLIKGKSFFTDPPELDEGAKESLNLAGQMAEIVGGNLSVVIRDSVFEVNVQLPAMTSAKVLAIDDNEDTLKLLHHFTNGTRYKLKGTQCPERVIKLAKCYAPQIIVLDVMMPQMDGWQILGHLNQHPATADIPIIVCTILGQKELAYALGANGFAQKPLNQASFLDALDRQMTRLTKEYG